MTQATETLGTGRKLGPTPLTGALFTLLAWLALFWALVVRARLHLGHWPKPRSGNPFSEDYFPGDVGPAVFVWHFDAAWLLLFAGGILFPFGLLELGIRGLVRDAWPSRRLVACFLATTLLAFWTVAADPGGFFTWWLD